MRWLVLRFFLLLMARSRLIRKNTKYQLLRLLLLQLLQLEPGTTKAGRKDSASEVSFPIALGLAISVRGKLSISIVNVVYIARPLLDLVGYKDIWYRRRETELLEEVPLGKQLASVSPLIVFGSLLVSPYSVL
jgi:hypothetical protein